MLNRLLGGAGAALSLLFLEETPEIFINDVDISIYDFWWSVVHRPKLFVEMLAKTPVSIAEWGRQRAIYRRRGRVSRLARGFSTFYLNRCNRSGIIMNGGPTCGVISAAKRAMKSHRAILPKGVLRSKRTS